MSGELSPVGDHGRTVAALLLFSDLFVQCDAKLLLGSGMRFFQDGFHLRLYQRVALLNLLHLLPVGGCVYAGGLGAIEVLLDSPIDHGEIILIEMLDHLGGFMGRQFDVGNHEIGQMAEMIRLGKRVGVTHKERTVFDQRIGLLAIAGIQRRKNSGLLHGGGTGGVKLPALDGRITLREAQIPFDELVDRLFGGGNLP